MSSETEPTWRICRKAVWMSIQNCNSMVDAKVLLNRQDENDLHIATGKFCILLQTVFRTSDESCRDRALAECRRLEKRCGADTAGGGGGGGWTMAVARRLFSFAAAAPGVDYYDRQIALADATACLGYLLIERNETNPSATTAIRAALALMRAWKTYQQCHAALLDVYRNVFDLDPDQNVPRWPPVLKRRQSAVPVPASNIGNRMPRSATTSFEANRQKSASDMTPQDVVRLMTAVSMGYGTFHLLLSLMPPTVVSIIGVFGFRGNRQTGLDALAFAKNGPGVHAPFAWAALTWYRMVGNTYFMFDGPRSRENEENISESEQLVCSPPEEFRDSMYLQYFIGRSRYLKGDLDGSIRAYEVASAAVDHGCMNMRVMCLHELGFMYIIRTDWLAACERFASTAKFESWMRLYHYFMATVCAGAAGQTATAVLMSRMVDETADGRWMITDIGGRFVMDRKRAVADALRTLDDSVQDGGRSFERRCRLIVYEAAYVEYGVARWPASMLHAVLADCVENNGDDSATRFTKQLLAVVCRKALGLDGGADQHRRALAQVVERMEREKRHDHLYVCGLYELAAEQISSPETYEEGKRTVQKMNEIKGPYDFQSTIELRNVSIQTYVQKPNVAR